MSNPIIARTGRALIEGKPLAEIARILDPIDGNPARHPHCVVIEAWHMATRQANKRIARKPNPSWGKIKTKRVPRIYRAEARNEMFRRPDIGNRHP